MHNASRGALAAAAAAGWELLASAALRAQVASAAGHHYDTWPQGDGAEWAAPAGGDWAPVPAPAPGRRSPRGDPYSPYGRKPDIVYAPRFRAPPHEGHKQEGVLEVCLMCA